MIQNPIAIVLGGTFPHIDLINKLKSKGYKTVLVDFAENPIAKGFADQHILESSLDHDKVLEIAKEIKADLVITSCSDQANVTACYVAQNLGLPAPYSYEVALSVTDKVIMKRIMAKNGIPTAAYHTVNKDWSFEEIATLKYPIIVKPADGYGSKGVRVARQPEELANNIVSAIKESRNGNAIIEEFIEGVEVGVDCYVGDGEAHVIMTKQRHKVQSSDNEIQQIYACTWPAVLSDMVERKFREISNQIAQAFELKDTPLMIQAIVKGDEVYVIEFGARIGGGNSYNIIKRRTGFDIIDASINSFLGRHVDLNIKPNSFFYADIFLYMESALFGYASNTEEMIRKGIIEDIVITKQRGTLIGNDLASRNRVGSRSEERRVGKECRSRWSPYH